MIVHTVVTRWVALILLSAGIVYAAWLLLLMSELARSTAVPAVVGTKMHIACSSVGAVSQW